MNTHFMNAVEASAKAEAILYAIDEVYMEDATDRLQYLFYAVLDAVRTCSAELELLDGDRRVVDAIYAVKDARRQKSIDM